MKRFLIVKPSSLGDVIHAFPAVSMLAETYPDAEIDWLVIPSLVPLVKYHPAVKNVILFRRKEMGKIASFPKAFLELWSAIRKNRYDAVIDLQGLFRSALISRLAKTSLVAGPAECRESISTIFYKRKLHPGEKENHAVRKNMMMMADFLGRPVPEKIGFEMKHDPEAAENAARKLGDFANKKYIAVAPGARWESKQWPPDFFAECIDLFLKNHPDHSAVLLGTDSEREQGEEMKKILKHPVLDLIGKTAIPELVECIRNASMLFCNDSGPMHIAAALNTPLTACFGPTDPVLTGPFTDLAAVLTPDIHCLKCFRRTCEKMECHALITPEQAVTAAETLLNTKS